MGHTGSLIGRIALWLVAALGILFFIMIYNGSETGIDGGLWVAYIAFLLCAGMALIFGIVQLITAGRQALPTVIGLVAFAAVILIAYSVADDSVDPSWGISPSTSKWIGAGLMTTYIAAGVAVLAILYGEIARMFK